MLSNRSSFMSASASRRLAAVTAFCKSGPQTKEWSGEPLGTRRANDHWRTGQKRVLWVKREPRFAFDAGRFLCSDTGSLFRIKFWGSEKLWIVFGCWCVLHLKAKQQGCTATSDCADESIDGGLFETSRLPISAKKKKENVEHPAGVHCQRTGYSLRRLSNIVS